MRCAPPPRSVCEHFGESYLQEALPKRAALRELPLTWHFIGRVQANKTRPLAQQFDWVHGVDRLKIAERLSAQRPADRAPLNVCLQINIAAEATKAGIAPADGGRIGGGGGAPAAAAPARADVHPARRACRRRAPPELRRLRALLQQLNARGAALDTLSMGMSADFREAILEGATLVRIGTALFGPRLYSSEHANGKTV